jgi:hypothetical protein
VGPIMCKILSAGVSMAINAGASKAGLPTLPVAGANAISLDPAFLVKNDVRQHFSGCPDEDGTPGVRDLSGLELFSANYLKDVLLGAADEMKNQTLSGGVRGSNLGIPLPTGGFDIPKIGYFNIPGQGNIVVWYDRNTRKLTGAMVTYGIGF